MLLSGKICRYSHYFCEGFSGKLPLFSFKFKRVGSVKCKIFPLKFQVIIPFYDLESKF